MDFILFLWAIIIGFVAAAPIGPVNVLCIQRTLNQGRSIGIISGLGAATADAVYGGIAGMGLTLISHILLKNQIWIRFAGGVFLCYLGVRIILAKQGGHAVSNHVRGFMGAYTSALVLTLANPTTIFSYGILFAGFGVISIHHGLEAAGFIVPGVFIGSALWWVILSGGAGMLRSRLNESGFAWANRISGAIVAGSGLLIILISVIPMCR
jgi:threonine/homoserine/homoserine lactone efflux protein